MVKKLKKLKKDVELEEKVEEEVEGVEPEAEAVVAEPEKDESGQPVQHQD